MRLSVLDQSPIQKGSTAAEALSETVMLAKLADTLGYTRFWVSEHHNIATLAGSTPEILITHLAGQTKHIRIGSGGVMLPHYSALKVAENFRMMEALFPGRIDLGIGRAPGGDRVTASILNPNNHFNEQDFVQQLNDLQNYLNDIADPGTVQSYVKATPVTTTVPQQWILSSSGQSAYFAAHFGMGFSFAHFINPTGGPKAVEIYKQRFKPSVNLATPQASAAFFIFCSEAEETIKQQQAIADNRFLQLETKGKLEAVDYDDVKDIVYTPAEQGRIEYNRQRMIIGNPDFVKATIEAHAWEYDIDEIVVANIATHLEQRLESYRLLAKLFNL